MKTKEDLIETLDFVAEYATHLLGSGVHTSRVIRNSQRIGTSQGIDIQLSSFQRSTIVTAHDPESGEAVTRVVKIPALPISFERNSDLSALSWDALDERLPLAEIRARYEKDGYLCDTHTAVAFHVAAQKKRDGVPMVVLSTASPFKFPRSVLEALGHTAPENDFEAMQALEEATGRTAPASLAVLRQKAERFSTVIDPAQIAEVALGCQA